MLHKFNKIYSMRNGFSLIEMMITIAIFLIISSAIFLTLATGRTYWYSGGVQISLQQEARRGLDYMVGELRQSRSSRITGVPSDGTYYNTITFKIPSTIATDGTITWSSDLSYSVSNNQLIRTPSKITGKVPNQDVLANNISSIRFMRDNYVPNLLNIEITAQKKTTQNYTISAVLQSEVKLRN